MSELMDKRRERSQRRHLLATVSALSLLCSAGASDAVAEEDHPTVWIELGPQFERAMTAQNVYSPAFFDIVAANGFENPRALENRLPLSFGGEGSISLHPKGSDWTFSVSARYGRAHGDGRHQQQTTPVVPTWAPTNVVGLEAARYENIRTTNYESHAILDFEVGKDIGIGLFGRNTEATGAFGIRYAQFKSKSSANDMSDPDFEVYKGKYLSGAYFPAQRYHAFVGFYSASRSFHGVGPSISLSGQDRLAGSPDSVQLGLDWGLNGSLLFGRQRMKVQHRTTGYSQRVKYQLSHFGSFDVRTDYRNAPSPVERKRWVVVPNIGGFASVSLNWPSAKLKLGYRADFFFGAMDGGFDNHASKDRDFYGPFATISIGVGG